MHVGVVTAVYRSSCAYCSLTFPHTGKLHADGVDGMNVNTRAHSGASVHSQLGFHIELMPAWSVLAKLVAPHTSMATQFPLLTWSVAPSGEEMDGVPPVPPDGVAAAAAMMALRREVTRPLLVAARVETAEPWVESDETPWLAAPAWFETVLSVAWAAVSCAVSAPLAVVDSAAICDDSVATC